MSEPLRILLLDQDNIGHDLDYQPLASLGQLILRNHTAAEVITRLIEDAAAAVVVANRPVFTPEILQKGAQAGLRLICLTATGTNTVDIAAARNSGIAICNIVGYSTTSVAQHTFALALELINRTSYFDSLAWSWHHQTGSTESGQPWTNLNFGIHELSGKTWGIIGMGAIGRTVATIAQAFGCRVIWASTSDTKRSEVWPQQTVDNLLAESDIVSIHSPINDASRNLLQRNRLALMRKTAILINVGRGGIVNESDLAAALANQTIAGAALDVLWPEPPAPDNPLLALPRDGRLILTPHIAWAAVEARQRAIVECAANIVAWQHGIRRNRVD